MVKLIVLFESNSDTIDKDALKKLVLALEAHGSQYNPIKITIFEEEE